ncbi:MAG TPA: hypothetical protein VFR35_00755, partial [Actinoplanes sp.]|nr:hypothetical protein [Actinoplanes sp.]
LPFPRRLRLLRATTTPRSREGQPPKARDADRAVLDARDLDQGDAHQHGRDAGEAHVTDDAYPASRYAGAADVPHDAYPADGDPDDADLLDRDADEEVDIDLGEYEPLRRPVGGLARIGLADDEDELSGDVLAADEREADQSEIEVGTDAADALEAEIDAEVDAGIDAELDEIDERMDELEERIDGRLDSEPAARVDRFGHRIEGWVRPQYRHQREPGEYWTPVPERSYTDAGYGWPVPVERLPSVPSYPPQSGFDLDPDEAAEPTAVVPQWPPAKPSSRIELPRSWAVRDQKERRSALMIQRRRPGDSTQTLPAVDDGDREPPRRRPRPRPSSPDTHSTVYRSRHAADPS